MARLGASSLLDAYFALEDPHRLEPAERELFVECDLESGLRLRGYVDRLDVAPDGALRVVDYKTGRAPREGFEAKAMFQMRFYALVLWRLRGEVPRLLQLLYLGSGEVLRYEPDEADLLATERKVLALWDGHPAGHREPATGGRTRAGSATGATTRRSVPAFGGTPPELPVLPRARRAEALAGRRAAVAAHARPTRCDALAGTRDAQPRDIAGMLCGATRSADVDLARRNQPWVDPEL